MVGLTVHSIRKHFMLNTWLLQAAEEGVLTVLVEVALEALEQTFLVQHLVEGRVQKHQWFWLQEHTR
jgi:hypothetical protein